MTATSEPLLPDPASVASALAAVGYLADSTIAGTVHLGYGLGRPVLVEGPAGTGKTELARSVAQATAARLIRLQCYEGLDESKALYEWDYRKQLLRIQSGQTGVEGGQDWSAVETDIFDEHFLLARPLLQAITAPDPVVLLIDEVDRLEVETEALLLEVLSDFQVTIPELGTITATHRPMVFLTSNNSRELSEALKRRCLFLHIGYPDTERERDIVLQRVPGIDRLLAEQVAGAVASLRRMPLRKRPSVSETVDWARTLVMQGVEQVDRDVVLSHLAVLLKHQDDIENATAQLSAPGPAVT